MQLKESKKKILQSLGYSLLPYVINVLCRTVKIKIANENIVDDLSKNNQKFVAAFWHGKMLIPWYYFGKHKFSALVSKSKDGEILTRVLERWNYKVVRGSSHIGGKQALELMQNMLANGFSVAITPDGPTGPQHKMKAGAVVLAKKMNVPLLLTAVCYKKKYIFKSWDSFELPKPFSTVFVMFSEPIFVKSNLTFDETNFLLKQVEEQMIKLQKKVEAKC